MTTIPISDYHFKTIIENVYAGYGRKITPEQIKVMYSRLGHVTEEALRSAARKWLDNNSKPPVVSDLLGLLGMNTVQARTHICTSCGAEEEHVKTVGTGENSRLVCNDCWYDIATKAGRIPAYRQVRRSA